MEPSEPAVPRPGRKAGAIATQQLHSVIHRSVTAVTAPAEASGDQSAETGPGSNRSPTPRAGGHATDSKDRICPKGNHATRRLPSCDSSVERDEAQIQKRVRRVTTSRKRWPARLRSVPVPAAASSARQGLTSNHSPRHLCFCGGCRVAVAARGEWSKPVQSPGGTPGTAYRHLMRRHL